MRNCLSRREALQSSAAIAAGVGLSGLDFLGQLSPLSAAQTKLAPTAVSFQPEIEPLVRLLEETPRDQVIGVIAGKIKSGASYRDVLSALFLAGIRNVQPRPSVGFKFHAVLVVNSAHLASLASPAEHRWLPLFWAIDNFKSAQARDVREGNWTMSSVDESKLPSAGKARGMLVDALDRWDEGPADVAAAALSRSAGLGDIYELLYQYGARDFRSIGHKAIYVANSWRTLACIGREHAEPIIRSLTYAILNRENNAGDDPPAERPFKRNQKLIDKIGDNWLDGKPDEMATLELLATLRNENDERASTHVVELLQRGVAVQSIWDAYFLAAAELLVRQPNIAALHAVTATNAIRFAFDNASSDRTRKLLLLQNAAFLPLFRNEANMKHKDFRIDKLEPMALDTGKAGNPADLLDEVYSTISSNRLQAAGKTLAYLNQVRDPQAFLETGRLLVFRKGTDSHDYKFSSAVMEDYLLLSPQWRNRFLAASVFNLRGSQGKDIPLVEQTRAALS